MEHGARRPPEPGRIAASRVSGGFHHGTEDSIGILLVEDNPGDVLLLREVLAESRLRSFEITHVERLSEALSAVGSRSFDVVMLDLELPDSCGLKTLERLLEARSDPPPVVVMTGLDDENVALRAVQAGAQDYVVKNQFEPRILLRTIQSAIERQRMLRALDRAKQREHYLATHHPLTQLPNRYLFRDRLSQALAGAERNGQWIAVLFLDLDRFKNINDTLGHSAGDAFLQEVARRLRRCIRSSDTVSHLAGDEFTVILNGITRALDAAKVAQNITRALSAPISIAGRELVSTASIGIAVYPTDGSDAETLIRNADLAMYKAKEEGRNAHRFFTPEMNARARERLALESDLRKAVERDELLLHYQPTVDGQTGRIVGAEALVRWRHRERGMIPPGDFIPLAEETGLIHPVGEWVLRAACRQVRSWEQQGLPSVPIAVNASPRQFWQHDFASVVRGILQDEGMEGDHLDLEITESCLMRDVEATVEILRSIKSLGVRVALDDFGTGYSSLSVLMRLPLDTIKVDRSFVHDCMTDERKAMITSAIIGLAQNLDLGIVAEGVELREHLQFLLDRNCRVMQGFLFSPPLPAPEFAALLARGRIDLREKPDPC